MAGYDFDEPLLRFETSNARFNDCCYYEDGCTTVDNEMPILIWGVAGRTIEDVCDSPICFCLVNTAGAKAGVPY